MLQSTDTLNLRAKGTLLHFIDVHNHYRTEAIVSLNAYQLVCHQVDDMLRQVEELRRKADAMLQHRDHSLANYWNVRTKVMKCLHDASTSDTWPSSSPLTNG
jgi:hypothetical protein